MTHPLLKQAETAGTPLIDGEMATFVWRGHQPPRLIGDFNRWEASRALELEPAAPGVWQRTLSFPRDTYMEYAYALNGARVSDSFNARRVPNGLGQSNHFFYMPEAAPSPWVRPGRGPRGEVQRLRLASPGHSLTGEFVGKQRSLSLYQPPTAEPCPLIVVYDGRDYVQRGRLPRIVDNLLAQNRIRPVALALVDNGGQRARGVEYACCEATVGFILNQVLPVARAELNLLDPAAAPGAYGVLGASMGGLMALYTALRAPHIFGAVLSQSGAFGVGETEMVVFDLVRDGAVKPLRVWLEVGTYDFPELVPPHRRMRALLEAKGYPLTYREYPGGHNYTAWRNEVSFGLETLFGR